MISIIHLDKEILRLNRFSKKKRRKRADCHSSPTCLGQLKQVSKFFYLKWCAFLSRLLLKKKKRKNSIIHIVTKNVLLTIEYMYTSLKYETARFFNNAVYFSIVLRYERKNYVLIFTFSHTHRDQMRKEKGERWTEETAQLGGKKKYWPSLSRYCQSNFEVYQ